MARRFGRQRAIYSRQNVLKHTSLVDVQPTTLAAGTDVTISLIQTADSPDYTTVTNGTTVAQVENNYLTRASLKLEVAPNGASYTSWLGVWLYRDERGAVADPADMNEFNLSPADEISGFQRKNTAYWARHRFSSNRDRLILTLRIPRRLQIMRPDTIWKLFLQNENGNTIAYSLTGRFYSRPC